MTLTTTTPPLYNQHPGFVRLSGMFTFISDNQWWALTTWTTPLRFSSSSCVWDGACRKCHHTGVLRVIIWQFLGLLLLCCIHSLFHSLRLRPSVFTGDWTSTEWTFKQSVRHEMWFMLASSHWRTRFNPWWATREQACPEQIDIVAR